MPELPEVEILRRHLESILIPRKIVSVRIHKRRCLHGSSPAAFTRSLVHRSFSEISRRGKYLIFQLTPPLKQPQLLVGHLGMTGRMFVQKTVDPLPRHTAIAMNLDRGRFVFEDPRTFGFFTLDSSAIDALGPEADSKFWSGKLFFQKLQKSRSPIKARLMDQSFLSGLGNIYSCEALHRANIAPMRSANKITEEESVRLLTAIRKTLNVAVRLGERLHLDFEGAGKRSGAALFYYGEGELKSGTHNERFRVYDRKGKPCLRCGHLIHRTMLLGRSTYYCPHCQN